MANGIFDIAGTAGTQEGNKAIFDAVSSGQLTQQQVADAIGQDKVDWYLKQNNLTLPGSPTPPAGGATVPPAAPGAPVAPTLANPSADPNYNGNQPWSASANNPANKPQPGNLGGIASPNGGPNTLSTNPTPTTYPTPIPAAPEFQNAASYQGMANLDAAKNTVALSNPDVNTTFGSQTVSIGADGRPVVNQSLAPDQQKRLDDLNSILPGVTNSIKSQLSQPLGSRVTQGIEAPTNSNLSARQTQTGTAGQSAVAEALRAREQPRLDAKRQQLEGQLLARGFNPGTEGWNEAIDDFSRSANDFNLGLTSLAGQEQSRLFNLDTQLRDQQLREGSNLFQQQTQNRNQQIGEEQLLRGLPIEEYSKLISAMQPTLPNFQQYQGAQVEAAPIFNAANAQGIFDLGRYGTMIQGELGTRGIDTSKGAANTELLSNLAGAFI